MIHPGGKCILQNETNSRPAFVKRRVERGFCSASVSNCWVRTGLGYEYHSAAQDTGAVAERGIKTEIQQNKSFIERRCRSAVRFVQRARRNRRGLSSLSGGVET